MKRALKPLLIVGVFLAIYVLLFVGYSQTRCGCGYKFYWNIFSKRNVYCPPPIPCEQPPMSKSQIIINSLLLNSVQTESTTLYEEYEAHKYTKLKLGLGDAVVLHNDGDTQLAIEKAKELSELDEQNRIFVTIITRNMSIEHEASLQSMGINNANLSKLTNLAGVFVSFDQLKQLNDADWVLYVTPPSRTVPTK